MDDDFLALYRRPPSAEFESDLYERLEKRRRIDRPIGTVGVADARSVRTGLIILAALALAGACARQVLAPRWVQIGDFQVYETSKNCSNAVSYPYTPSTPDATNPPPDPARLLTLDEIKTRLAYDLKIPIWAPEGFQPRVAITDVIPMMPINYYWNQASGLYSIYLYVSPVQGEHTELTAWAARGTAEAVSINGDPGLLRRGGCGYGNLTSVQDLSKAELVWDENINGLAWRSDGVSYSLYSHSPDVSAEDLVRMAESAD